MPGPLLHVGAEAICPHKPPGKVVFVSSNNRVKINGMPAITMNDNLKVGGCSAGQSQCVSATFKGASKVRINSHPAVIYMAGTGFCPPTNLPPEVLSVQRRVIGV